jgi:hypothetical protein
MSLNIGICNATSIYINKEVVLLYFIAKGRIKAFETEIQPSDWLELSENLCVQINIGAAAADRIIASNLRSLEDKV